MVWKLNPFTGQPDFSGGEQGPPGAAQATPVTRAEYDLLSPPQAETLYRITDEPGVFYVGAERVGGDSLTQEQEALLNNALQPEDVGTAAAADIGSAVGNVPVLIDGGGGVAQLDPAIVPGVTGGGFYAFDDPTRTLTITEGQLGGPVFDDATRTLTV
jgi:hypothetical protein